MNKESVEHICKHRNAQNQEYYDHLADTIALLAVNAVAQYEPFMPIKVADVGCGRGEVLLRLCRKGYKVVGVDIDPKNIDHQGEKIPVVQGDLLNLSSVKEAKGSKIVVLSHVLEHVHSPLSALEECKKLGAEWIIIAVPNLGRWTLARKPKLINSGHQLGWDMNHLRTFLECHAKLKIEEWAIDKVTLRFRKYGCFLRNPVYRYLENHILPWLFPQLATSLIVLCKVTKNEI